MSGNELIDTINSLQKRHSDKPVQLPLWYPAQRGTPNSFLRSALFPAIKSRDRQWLKDAVLDSQQGITVKFTGQQFNQEDLTVWEAVVHLVRENPLGNEYTITAHGILKSAGMGTGSTQHQQLYESLSRLVKGTVEIRHQDKRRFLGHLINSLLDDRSQHYKITVNKELIALYQNKDWTPINMQERGMLKGKPLAQALHGYYSTHQQPYSIKISTVAAIVGSRSKNMRSFKQKVNEALRELVGIGFLDGFDINENNMVTVIKKSQKATLP